MRTLFDRPVFARARRLCLALPETSETLSWGHPNFRAGKKTFCTFEMITGPSIAFKLSLAQARQTTKRTLLATPYGRGVWVSLWVDEPPDWAAVSALVELSYRGVAITRMLIALDQLPSGRRH